MRLKVIQVRQIRLEENFTGSPGLHSYAAGGMALIPGQGTEMLCGAAETNQPTTREAVKSVINTAENQSVVQRANFSSSSRIQTKI